MAEETLQVKTMSVSLSVNDLALSRRFYTDGLGFTVDQEMKDDKGVVQGIMLTTGAASLGMSQDDFAKGRDRVKGTGMSIYLETTQDIAALAKRARAAGVNLDADPAPLPWGPMGFSVKDPDGFKVFVSNVG